MNIGKSKTRCQGVADIRNLVSSGDANKENGQR